MDPPPETQILPDPLAGYCVINPAALRMLIQEFPVICRKQSGINPSERQDNNNDASRPVESVIIYQ